VVAPYFCFVLISRVVVGLSVFCTELLDLQFRGGGSSCKFGGDDEKKFPILLQDISTLLLECSLNFGGDGCASHFHHPFRRPCVWASLAESEVGWLGKQRGREGGWSRGPDGSLGGHAHEGHAQGHHVTAAVADDEDPEVWDLLRED